MIVKYCKCAVSKKGKFIGCYFFLERMIVRMECDKCKGILESLLHIPGIVYWSR